MMSLYQIFRIIFGIIISVFILVVLLFFIGNYSDVQEDSQRAHIVKNFLKTSGDVYTTGNAIPFTDFSRKEFSLSFDTNPPEGIISNTGKTPVYFPLFYSPDDELLISRESLDMGWWEFYFVEAMPRTKIFFNPVDTSDQTWDLVRSIVSTFPSTEFFEPKVTFGFCDGPVLIEDFCSGNVCERDDFLFQLTDTGELAFSKCTATPLPEDAVVIKILTACSVQSNRVICLEKPNPDGIGNMQVGSLGYVIYKDPLDVVVSVIGGGDKDIYGYSGLSLFEYKNNVFREELHLAAQILSYRATLIESAYPVNSECHTEYSKFLTTMNSLATTLNDKGYYKNFGTITTLVNQLSQAKAEHESLVIKGCDYA